MVSFGCYFTHLQDSGYTVTERKVKLQPVFFLGGGFCFLHHTEWDGAQERGNWQQLREIMMIWNWGKKSNSYKESHLVFQKQTVHSDDSDVLYCIKNSKCSVRNCTWETIMYNKADK